MHGKVRGKGGEKVFGKTRGKEWRKVRWKGKGDVGEKKRRVVQHGIFFCQNLKATVFFYAFVNGRCVGGRGGGQTAYGRHGVGREGWLRCTRPGELGESFFISDGASAT